MTKRKILSALVLIVFIFINYTTAFCEPAEADTAAPPQLKSESAVLMDQKTGKVLYDKDSHKKAYPASLTKILTALLILENMDMKETVTVGREIENVEADASEAGLAEGEKLTGSDLLWALMLPSGNDAAYTAAVNIAGKKSGKADMSITEAVTYFSGMMNKRAQELGAKGSNFVNPDGYPHDDHYSTAYDMALISREALKNEFFKEVVSTYIHEKGVAAEAADSKKVVWYNKNQLINKKSKYYYEYAKGIKTGHTNAAGYCLSSYAEKDDRSFISVVLKAASEETRWVETTALFKYAFDNFKQHTFLKKGQSVSSAAVVRKYFGGTVNINILADAEYTDILTDKAAAEIKQVIEWDPGLLKPGEDQTGQIKLVGPISGGQIIGKASYVLEDKVLFTTELVASQDALKGDFTDKIVGIIDSALANKIVILVFLALVIVAAAMLIVFTKWRKKTLHG